MKSNDLRPDDGQLSFPALRKDWRPLDVLTQIEIAERCKTQKAAWVQMAQNSPYEDAKEIYGRVDIDGATWSRIVGGTANPPMDLLPAIERVCDNRIFTYWVMAHTGIDPRTARPYQTEIEKENEALRAKVDAMQTLMGLKTEGAG